MDHDVLEISHHPAIAGLPLDVEEVIEFLFDEFPQRSGQRLQHAVAGAVADDEIIRKCGDLVNIKQKNIFGFLVLQEVDDLMRFFDGLQFTPRYLRWVNFSIELIP